MSIYASKTQVSSGRSKEEIERVLRRYGADEFVSGWDESKAVVMFKMADRRIRFYLPMPDKEQFAKNKRGHSRPAHLVDVAYEQATRQRWRALGLAIKAKLEAVESGITSFEEEFLAHIVMPNGKNLGHVIAPQIAESYEKKKMPPLLGSGGGIQ